MSRSLLAAMAAIVGLAGSSGGYRSGGRKSYSRKLRASRRRKRTTSSKSKRKRKSSKTARNSALDKGWW